MKATEFVKKHGWEDVISALRSTTREETAAFESTDLEPILSKKGSHIGFNVKIHEIKYDDVERLVESHEIVESHGGLNGAKNTLALFMLSVEIGLYHGIDGVNAEVEIPQLKQAISDVERCQ